VTGKTTRNQTQVSCIASNTHYHCPTETGWQLLEILSICHPTLPLLKANRKKANQSVVQAKQSAI